MIFLSGCLDAPDNSNFPDSKQNLVIGEPWGLGSVEPSLKGNTLSNFRITEGLTSISPDLKISPGLASSWDYVGNDTWRFNLEKGVKFHDGSIMDANDVKSALDRSIRMNPNLDGTLNIKEIKVVDKNTVDIITKKTDSSLPGRMAYGAAGIYKNNEQSDGKITFPVGTGPFKFVNYDKASDVMNIKKNEEYRGDLAKLDTVTIRYGIEEANTREMAVEKGEVDFTTETTVGSTKRLSPSTASVLQ